MRKNLPHRRFENYRIKKSRPEDGSFFCLCLAVINGFFKLESVIFLIESVHMEHKVCFAVKIDKKENIGRDSVDSHGVTGEFDSAGNDIDPHVSYEMVGHVVVACFVCIFCIVGAHKVEEHAVCSFRKKRNKMIEFAPEHDEGSGGTNHCGHDGKGETAGFTVEKIKSACDEKETEEIKKISHFGSENNFNRSKHKAHTDNYRKSAL